MKDLLSERYAERVPQEEIVGKMVELITFHIMECITQKTDKLRVVFDCSARFKGCANFGLKQSAIDHEKEYGSDVGDFIRHNFYVDDGLKSVATEDEAAHLINRSKLLCQRVGLKLHKFTSNSTKVMGTLPPEEHSKGVKDLNVMYNSSNIERALGVYWCVESDTFQFRISLQDKPLTRRGILSIVSSVYDPLGFLAPVVLVGKQILQEMCSLRILPSPVP
ncbi:hypothetical protein BSL78_18184 [Apostichopus japonicus]|uniref:Uncharacterized protein n=1 Tax=Stichopus japonicus TaxID=307972 RepID=A0A2G8KAD5_STIJA|nr:hypothetical protein BSL78_18184 [Apostichopus japonicus]